ncbi:MAG: hypothetical protein GX552_13260 [Chloroflexi bacterium]|nr:hypothetical protein [Chloroflexota bacterium]
MSGSYTKSQLPPDWTNKRSRIYWYDQYALNEQETAFAQYDPERIVHELVSTGADIVAVYAANQFGIAYYPSHILPQHPGLKGRDYFGEVSSRLQSQGVKVIAYVNWLNSTHAEWNLVPLGKSQEECTREKPLVSWADPSQPNGRVQNLAGGAWEFPCPLSPRAQQMTQVAEEIVTRYHPDAFHMDMFHGVGICLCERCRKALEGIFGTQEITAELINDHWAEYISWRTAVSADVVAGVSAVLRKHGVIAAHNAGVPLLPVSYGFSEAWLPSLDVFLSEAFDAFLAHPTDLNTTSVIVRLQHAVGKPAWILRTSAQIHYAHWPISETQWRIYAAACKANGCKAFGPCGIGAYPDTTSSAQMLSRVKQAFDFYMEDADLDEGATSAAAIALAFSWDTRKHFDEHPASGTVDWAEDFMGWARLLIEEHLPYDIVIADTATAADLAKYTLIILPDLANLSDSACAALREYVSKGGRILATGSTSLRDEKGKTRAEFALAEVLGIANQGSVKGHFAVQLPIGLAPASGTLQHVQSNGVIRSLCAHVDPAGSVGGVKDPMPIGISDWPVWMEHQYACGQAVYVAFDIGRFYELHGDEHIGGWMSEIVDGILPFRQIVVKAPRTVETTLWQQERPRRTIIHLANRTVPWTLPTDSRQPTEIIPLRDIQLSLECEWRNPRVSCRGAQVSARMDGHQLTVSVAELGAYAAILVEPESD